MAVCTVQNKTFRKKNSARQVPPCVVAMWDDYFSTRSDESRNRIVEHYLPLVTRLAEYISAKLPSEVILDDLVSDGSIGLLDAIRMFDAGRGYKFETYAAPRIRGAMLDGIRASDWIPRLTRSRTSRVESVSNTFYSQRGRKPDNAELQKLLGLNDREFAKVVKDQAIPAPVSLSRKWFTTDSDRDVREVDNLADGNCPDPSLRATSNDAVQVAFRGLDTEERMIFGLYNIENLTMKQIGYALGVSESRISQVYGNIVARLRAELTRNRDRLLSIHPDMRIEGFSVEVDGPDRVKEAMPINRPVDTLGARRDSRHYRRCNRGTPEGVAGAV
jgi:RNA polymerase sigma factor for flagellar operon FliA